MAGITSCPKVVEVEPKVRSHGYRDLMVGVQVTLALAETLSQLGQHLFYGRRTQFELPEVCHYVGLPSAVHASPLVPDEAVNTQSAMGGVITAAASSASTRIALLVHSCLMQGAIAPPDAYSAAAGLRAGCR
jgi:hypothetical protein